MRTLILSLLLLSAQGKPKVTADSATAVCKDSTLWQSKMRAFSCARHGGVARWTLKGERLPFLVPKIAKDSTTKPRTR